jgi:dipeptidase
MCDTFVATPETTGRGTVILGKNSDREPNEPQALQHVPRREWSERTLRVTHVEVPQVRETFAALLSRPFHMWGAEMGVNEHGLAIGNEAVFTRVRFAKRNDGLTGMDLLRLALERCCTAEQAVECMTDLLARHGQDAYGGYQSRRLWYHGSFLVADPRSAWLLETAGREWAAVRVRGYRAISNGLTIEEDFDLASPGAATFARRQGWLRRGETFSFRRAYSDRLYTTLVKCRARRALSTTLGSESAGRLDPAAAMRILRSHGGRDADPGFDVSRCDAGCICMHATGVLSPSQTCGSLVAELRPDGPSTAWLTGTAAPCLSLFKPLFPGPAARAASAAGEPGATADRSLWWRHEAFHRRALAGYAAVERETAPERDSLEAELLAAERALFAGGRRPEPGELERLSRRALAAGDAALERWTASASARGVVPRRSFFYVRRWRRLSQAVALGR